MLSGKQFGLVRNDGLVVLIHEPAVGKPLQAHEKVEKYRYISPKTCHGETVCSEEGTKDKHPLLHHK